MLQNNTDQAFDNSPRFRRALRVELKSITGWAGLLAARRRARAAVLKRPTRGTHGEAILFLALDDNEKRACLDTRARDIDIPAGGAGCGASRRRRHLILSTCLTCFTCYVIVHNHKRILALFCRRADAREAKRCSHTKNERVADCVH